MGIDLINPCLAIPQGREPDWERAAAWLAGLDPVTVLDTGDELFPIELWEEEAALARENGESDATFIEQARDSLRSYASIARSVIEHPAKAGLLVVDLPAYRVYMASAMDGGEGPGEIVDAFIYSAESGVALAAGFEHWTRFASTELDERSPSQPSPKGNLAIPPIKPGSLPKGRLASEWIAWFSIEEADWPAAGQQIDELQGLPDDERSTLESDLDLLRGYLEGEYSRVVIGERIGSVELWVAADFARDGARAVEAIRRLGEAGTLEAAGALAWQAPQREDEG